MWQAIMGNASISPRRLIEISRKVSTAQEQGLLYFYRCDSTGALLALLSRHLRNPRDWKVILNMNLAPYFARSNDKTSYQILRQPPWSSQGIGHPTQAFNKQRYWHTCGRQWWIITSMRPWDPCGRGIKYPTHLQIEWWCMCKYYCTQRKSTMTSWNGNIFGVTGHLCGSFTGDPYKGQWCGALMFSLVGS